MAVFFNNKTGRWEHENGKPATDREIKKYAKNGLAEVKAAEKTAVKANAEANSVEDHDYLKNAMETEEEKAAKISSLLGPFGENLFEKQKNSIISDFVNTKADMERFIANAERDAAKRGQSAVPPTDISSIHPSIQRSTYPTIHPPIRQ